MGGRGVRVADATLNRLTHADGAQDAAGLRQSLKREHGGGGSAGEEEDSTRLRVEFTIQLDGAGD